MDEILASLAPLGVGGIIAYIVLMWKRADDQRYAGELKADREQMMSALAANSNALQEVSQTLIALLEAQRAQAHTEQALSRIESRLSRFDTKALDPNKVEDKP